MCIFLTILIVRTQVFQIHFPTLKFIIQLQKSEIVLQLQKQAIVLRLRILTLS
jgi:hypothetical protein